MTKKLVVVNGFFRSGTSIIWEILKKDNPEFSVFYEPCHNELFWYLDQFRKTQAANEFHGMDIWQEYFEYPNLIEDLMATHPNIGPVFPESSNQLEAYVEKFLERSDRIVLQTNRWHFMLGQLSKSFDASVVHIVRNPISIFESIKQAMFRSKIKCLKKVFPNVFLSRAFYIDEMFNYCIQRYCWGRPEANNFKKPIGLNAFDKFIFVWVVTNYFAIKSVRELGGNIVTYESLLNCESRFSDSFLGVGLNFDMDDRVRYDLSSTVSWTSKYNHKLVEKSVEKSGLEDQFLYILNEIGK